NSSVIGKMEKKMGVRGGPPLDDPCPERRKAGDLHGQLVLIRPQPRHVTEALALAEHVARGNPALVVCTLPAFQPRPGGGIEKMMRERAGVAGSKNGGVAGTQVLIDDDSVVDGEPRLARQLDTWRNADRHENNVAVDRGPVVENDAGHLCVA